MHADDLTHLSQSLGPIDDPEHLARLLDTLRDAPKPFPEMSTLGWDN